jgi:methionyl-tRNA formyltransferase
MKFAALGRTKWLYDAITLCAERGHTPVLIGTCPAAPEYTVGEDDFRRLAETLGCDFLCDTNLDRPDYVRRIRDASPDVAISVNWMTVLGSELLNAFPLGVINAHAGDLPRFRGNACPNWAILAGEPRIVLTLHRMTAELDAGPIFLQRPFEIGEDTYIGDVYRFLDANIPVMFRELLDGLADDAIAPREQPADPALALRCFPRRPEDGLIDWSRTACEIGRLVRASAEPFAGAYTYLDGERLTVWRARPISPSEAYMAVPGQVIERRTPDGEVLVATGDGFLAIQQVGLPAGPREPATDVIRSTRARLGMRIEDEIDMLKRELMKPRPFKN